MSPMSLIRKMAAATAWIAPIAPITLMLALSGATFADATKGAPTATGGPATKLNAELLAQLLKTDSDPAVAIKRDRNLEMAIAASGDSDAIESWWRRFNGNEDAREAVRSTGMVPLEYFRSLVALLQAESLAGLKSHGKEVPIALVRAVPPDNLAFVEQHKTEVGAWMARTGVAPTRAKSVKPNTIEDIYAPPAQAAATAPAAAADGTAPATTEPAAAAPATTKPPAKAGKKTAKAAPASPPAPTAPAPAPTPEKP